MTRSLGVTDRGVPLPLVGLTLGVGLAGGVLVTRRLHGPNGRRFWAARLGRTRLRRADLPVGGTLTLAVSMVAPPRLRRPLRALALGAAAGVALVAATDPLPAQDSA